MSPQELKRRLEFYRDLGVKQIYRRVKPIDLAAIPIELPSLVPDGDTLQRISDDIGDCTRCRL